MEATVNERPIPTGEGLTFEKVWAMFQETDRQFKETRKQMKETARIVKENAKLMKETREQMKETDRQIGNLGHRFGELAEHLVAPNIMEKFNEQGFHFNETATDKKFADSETHKVIVEVDVFLENGDIAMAVEVKAKPKIKDVDDHIRRMEVLRRHADRKHDKLSGRIARRFQGAIAGAIMGGDVRRYILKNGFYVIEQTGDTVQIAVPEGFKAREW
jgi:hypothetical protein